MWSSAEQIMAMPAEVDRRWTAREVRDLIAAAPLATPRYELVDGELLVTPSPGAPHQLAITRLFAVLIPYLDRERVGQVLSSPSDVELERDLITQPDLFVVPRGELRRVLASGLPYRELLLAIESHHKHGNKYAALNLFCNPISYCEHNFFLHAACDRSCLMTLILLSRLLAEAFAQYGRTQRVPRFRVLIEYLSSSHSESQMVSSYLLPSCFLCSDF